MSETQNLATDHNDACAKKILEFLIINEPYSSLSTGEPIRPAGCDAINYIRR